MKKILLFLISLIVSTTAVVGYFELTQKVSTISLPSLPSVSLSNLIKLTRFSLDKAPSESLVGNIISMTGEVEHEERLATESAKITSPKSIQQGESLTTGVDGKINLTFAKALDLTIFQNTTLGITQTLPADVVFTQKIGQVEYKKLSEIPVSIRSLHLLIENEGDIIVSVEKDEPFVTVEVLSGFAKVAYNNASNDTKYLEVNAGHKIIFNDDTRRVVQE